LVKCGTCAFYSPYQDKPKLGICTFTKKRREVHCKDDCFYFHTTPGSLVPEERARKIPKLANGNVLSRKLAREGFEFNPSFPPAQGGCSRVLHTRPAGGEIPSSQGLGHALISLISNTLFFTTSAFTLWVFLVINTCDIFKIFETNVSMKEAELVVAIVAFLFGLGSCLKSLARAYRKIAS
jgi:hypothetical protein